jgi:poly(A) polymerase/tRNA nucleotidyltransferase (CCA-adding enzyme)
MKKIKMKLNIPGDIKNDISDISGKLKKKGYQCYLVGGSVRDFVLDIPVFDYDLATDAHPENVIKLFSKVIPTGIRHGTVTILSKENKYEMTTYRSDGKYINGRRPESVTFSDTLEKDVERRDFTINGLAYDIENEELIDLVGGLEDIERKTVRTIGNPVDRFREDGLRPYRSCRFAAKLNFTIEDATFAAISETLEVAKKVSVERVRDELTKVIESEKPSIGFEYMRKSGLLGLCLPELLECYNVSQNKYHIYDIYYHSIYSCDAIPGEDKSIKLAALLHDIGKAATRKEGEDGDNTFYNHEVVGAKITRKLMKRLRFSNEEIEKVNNLVLNHMFHYMPEWSDGAVRRFMRKVGLENLNNLFLLRLADRRGNGQRDGLPGPITELKNRIKKVIEQDSALTVRDLEIDGYVIMKEFDIKPGPVIGRILNSLLEIVLDEPEANTRDILLEKAGVIYREFTDKDGLKNQ